jgi:hypothetical protein
MEKEKENLDKTKGFNTNQRIQSMMNASLDDFKKEA